MHVILACLLLCTHGYQENISCGSLQAVMRMQSNESNNWGRNTDLINWFFSSLWPLINRTGNKVLAINESTFLKRRLLILGTNCATYSTRQRTQKSLNRKIIYSLKSERTLCKKDRAKNNNSHHQHVKEETCDSCEQWVKL